MDLSSGSMERIERRSMLEHGPHHGYAASCESDDGLDVAFSFAPLAVVEGSGSRVSRGASAECGLEEHAFQRPVAAKGAAQGAGLSRLAQNGGKACGGGESIWRAETGDVACRGDELGREDDPHTRQAADEGRIRVASDESFQVLIELIGRKAGRVRTSSAMTRASRGSDLRSPPVKPWLARLTAIPGTWTRGRPSASSTACKKVAIEPSTSRPIVTASSWRRSAASASSASCVLSTARSIRTRAS